jgi:hypothetical protein
MISAAPPGRTAVTTGRLPRIAASLSGLDDASDAGSEHARADGEQHARGCEGSGSASIGSRYA